jgi:hypothetical protein
MSPTAGPGNARAWKTRGFPASPASQYTPWPHGHACQPGRSGCGAPGGAVGLEIRALFGEALGGQVLLVG